MNALAKCYGGNTTLFVIFAYVYASGGKIASQEVLGLNE